jgi:hypothetical protein
MHSVVLFYINLLVLFLSQHNSYQKRRNETREVDKHIDMRETRIVENVEQNAIECSNK